MPLEHSPPIKGKEQTINKEAQKHKIVLEVAQKIQKNRQEMKEGKKLRRKRRKETLK